ncbi:unnamed protein product [Gulo gulo]|uniref:Uncharacterized protein n=1 Tax=Gulo gulo TaxID=48420 RepID=A0A9X9Q7K9_GULGU|nr:unnamed protein product [Gulo gulo]
MAFLILEILNSFHRRLKSMEKLEIWRMLFTLNASGRKSQLFLRSSSLKHI